jgi:hypothetical protein
MAARGPDRIARQWIGHIVIFAVYKAVRSASSRWPSQIRAVRPSARSSARSSGRGGARQATHGQEEPDSQDMIMVASYRSEVADEQMFRVI